MKYTRLDGGCVTRVVGVSPRGLRVVAQWGNKDRPRYNHTILSLAYFEKAYGVELPLLHVVIVPLVSGDLEKKDMLEFWIGQTVIQSIESSHAPVAGDLVSIRGRTLRVIGRSYALDHADRSYQRAMRCNVIVEELPVQSLQAKGD